MTASEFITKHKDTTEIVSMSYESGPFDKFITAYPKGITNPHVVEFKESSVMNWKRMRKLLDQAVAE